MECRKSPPSQEDDDLPDGLTDMHLAAFGGSVRMVQLLVGAGADPNAATTASCSIGPQGITPLHVAAASGNAAVINLLLDGGARPDVCDQARTCSCGSALFYSTCTGKLMRYCT